MSNKDNRSADEHWAEVVDLIQPRGIKALVEVYGYDHILSIRKNMTLGEAKNKVLQLMGEDE